MSTMLAVAFRESRGVRTSEQRRFRMMSMEYDLRGLLKRLGARDFGLFMAAAMMKKMTNLGLARVSKDKLAAALYLDRDEVEAWLERMESIGMAVYDEEEEVLWLPDVVWFDVPHKTQKQIMAWKKLLRSFPDCEVVRMAVLEVGASVILLQEPEVWDAFERSFKEAACVIEDILRPRADSVSFHSMESVMGFWRQSLKLHLAESPNDPLYIYKDKETEEETSKDKETDGDNRTVTSSPFIWEENEEQEEKIGETEPEVSAERIQPLFSEAESSPQEEEEAEEVCDPLYDPEVHGEIEELEAGGKYLVQEDFEGKLRVIEKAWYTSPKKMKVRLSSVLFDVYMEENKVLPKPRVLTRKRLMKCMERMRQARKEKRVDEFIEEFREAVRICNETPFLRGVNRRGWKATFDWLVANDTNMYKVLEGNYSGSKKEAVAKKTYDAMVEWVNGNPSNALTRDR